MHGNESIATREALGSNDVEWHAKPRIVLFSMNDWQSDRQKKCDSSCDTFV